MSTCSTTCFAQAWGLKWTCPPPPAPHTHIHTLRMFGFLLLVEDGHFQVLLGGVGFSLPSWPSRCFLWLYVVSASLLYNPHPHPICFLFFVLVSKFAFGRVIGMECLVVVFFFNLICEQIISLFTLIWVKKSFSWELRNWGIFKRDLRASVWVKLANGRSTCWTKALPPKQPLRYVGNLDWAVQSNLSEGKMPILTIQKKKEESV